VSGPDAPDAPDRAAAAFALGHGPWLLALRGKIPVFGAWERMPPATEDDIRDLLEVGFNLGFRTGTRSGLVVIDDDQGRHGGGPYVPPPTGLVSESPTGGRHYYYRAPDPCPGNSASRLAPHVDVRGEGGQVVYPGSIHPIEHRPYRWVSTSEPGTLPEATLAVLRGPVVHVDTTRPVDPPQARASTGGADAYAETALVREAARVRAAPEGTRNIALNNAALSLGQLVAGGALPEFRVRDELTSAAKIAGLEDREIAATLRSGLTAGAKQPRCAPERATATRQRADAPPERRRGPDILVPGSHVLPTGQYEEQGADTFARAVLDALPAGTVYRRAQVVGRIADDQFRPLSPDRMRSVIDAEIHLVAGKPAKDDGDPVLLYRPCTADNARLVAAYAEADGTIRALDHLATYPVCIGDNYVLAAPGWNQSANTFLTSSDQHDPLDLPTARAVLEDLVADFPFAQPADRTNFFGLLLTPILRPSLREPVPMHLITSPIERTGKTKLAETVFGCAILGRPTPAMQLGVREEEREKRITALLISGTTVVHLDNLDRFLNSPSLASLLTSTEFQGRELNYSRILSLPNGMTIVGTGNNVQASGELSKRIAPIYLQSPLEAPESRQDYRHPDLRAYVESERPRVLGALLGLVAAWRAAGMPRGSVPFGGFERWSAVVGGILAVAGYQDHLANLAKWRGTSDEMGVEIVALVAAWQTTYAGREWVDTSELYDLATAEGLFERDMSSGRNDHGRRVAFGINVLGSIDGRTVSGWRIELAGAGKRRRARLVDPTDDR
jgi:hypothetical protein